MLAACTAGPLEWQQGNRPVREDGGQLLMWLVVLQFAMMAITIPALPAFFVYKVLCL